MSSNYYILNEHLPQKCDIRRDGSVVVEDVSCLLSFEKSLWERVYPGDYSDDSGIIFMKPDEDVEARDIIVLDDEWWIVQSSPMKLLNPMSFADASASYHHIELSVKRQRKTG